MTYVGTKFDDIGDFLNSYSNVYPAVYESVKGSEDFKTYCAEATDSLVAALRQMKNNLLDYIVAMASASLKPLVKAYTSKSIHDKFKKPATPKALSKDPKLKQSDLKYNKKQAKYERSVMKSKLRS